MLSEGLFHSNAYIFFFLLKYRSHSLVFFFFFAVKTLGHYETIQYYPKYQYESPRGETRCH